MSGSPLRTNSSLASHGSTSSLGSPKTPGSSSFGSPGSETGSNGGGAAADAAANKKPAGSKEFIQRVVFTLIMAYGFLGLVSQGVEMLIPTIILIMVLMFHEILRINQKERKYRQMPYFRILPWYFLVVTILTATSFHVKDVVLATYPAEAQTFYHSFGLLTFGLFIVGFVFFVLALRKGLYRYQIGQFTWIAMTLLFIVGQGSVLLANMLRGVFWFLLPVSCVVHNDIWAYAWGKSFGRTKLLRLSPKKTLEGFLGAWLFTMVWAFWFSGFMCNFPSLVCPKVDLFSSMHCKKEVLFVHVATPVPEWVTMATFGIVKTLYIAPVQYHSLVFAAFASLIAPFGGFFASGLKRAFKLKDFGDLIPGHGGMTDRMDCQIITGMFAYVYLTSYVYYEGKKPACGNPAALLKCVQGLPPDAQRNIAQEVLAGLGAPQGGV